MIGNNLRGNVVSRAMRVPLIKWVKEHKSISITISGIILLIVISIVVVFAITHEKTAEVKLTQVGLEYQQKLPELKKSVDKAPNDATARKNYGVALYATGDLEGAKKQYGQAAKLNNKDAVILNNLGNIYRDLGNVDKAIDTYNKSIQLNPKSLNTYANLANIQMYSENKPQDAIDTYNRGLSELPNNTQLELLLAIAYEHAGDVSNAKKTYNAILSHDANNSASKLALERLR
ncbi:MAG: repeat:HAT (Half-A-TPR) repeat [Candidatus Saccharibacteria bacterium]|nr:repeat:HAT (Half-A-TPR) repeat [Candidatus Saccharibacteria bacterium]